MIKSDTISQIQEICRKYDIKPTKGKGQNFLLNQEVISSIVSASEIKNQDQVLEIGPGLGILTEKLTENAKTVVAVELDLKVFRFLKAKFLGTKNLKLIQDDILKLNVEDLVLGEYKIIANLPYNITSLFLKKFLTAENKPTDLTLLLQKEVAERICAKPGAMSLLAISVQLYGNPEIIQIVDRKDFWPSPKVDSAIIKISAVKNQVAVDNFFSGEVTEKLFWQIVKIGFASRRKQLHNNLASGFKISSLEVKKILKQANFNEMIRAQSLSVNDWMQLCRLLVPLLKK